MNKKELLKGIRLEGVEVEAVEKVALFVDRLESLYAERLLGILLFGSAARGAYVPKRSNLNLLVALDRVGSRELLEYRKVRSEIEKFPIATPLFLEPNYVRYSTDTFPLEFLDIRSFHTVLDGQNILESITIDPKLLRLELEREIKGKLLLARQSFLEANGDSARLLGILSRSFAALRVIFFGIVYLRENRVVRDARELVERVSEHFGLNPAALFEVGRARSGELKPSKEEMEKTFFAYLEELVRLAEKVDAI
jgi:predicted nucleotidyltransferase